MKVKATKTGYYGDRLISRGDTFELPEGAKCSWAVPESEFKEPIAKSQAQLAADAKEGAQGKRKKKEKPSEQTEEKVEEKVEEKPAKKAAKKAAKKPATKKAAKKD